MIAFTLPGGVPVYAFSLLMALGASAGLAWVAWRSSLESSFDNLNAGLWLLVGALVGGRLLHVFVAWPYYNLHRLEIPQVFMGGLAWPGAFLGGALAVAVYAAVRRLPIASLAASLLPLAVCITVFAWLACWIDGCAYARPATGAFAAPLVDEWGQVEERFPLQFLGAVLALAALGLLDAVSARLSDGLYASLGLMLLAAQLTLLSTLRADPVPLWRGLRLDIAVGVFLSLCFAGLTVVAVLRSELRSADKPKPD